MPPLPDAPLRKVTLNLYDADVIAMEKLYGHGWSTMVRILVNDHTSRAKNQHIKRTIEDIIRDQGT